MAKPKKKTKTPKKIEVIQPKEPPKDAPEVKPEHKLIMLSDDEVTSLTQILAFSRDVFKQMSMNCALQNDTKAEVIYSARSELSDHLFKKIQLFSSIGEPTSRAFH